MKLVNCDAAGFNDQRLEGLDYPHKTSEGAPQFLSEGVILRPHAPRPGIIFVHLSPQFVIFHQVQISCQLYLS